MKSKLALFLLSASAAFAGFDATFLDFVPTGTNQPVWASFTWSGENITAVGSANVPDQGMGVFTGSKLIDGEEFKVKLELYDFDTQENSSVPFVLSFNNETSGTVFATSFSVTVYGFGPVNPMESIDSINVIGANSLNRHQFSGAYNVGGRSLTFGTSNGFNIPSGGQAELFADFSTSVSAVPEPATVALGFGIAAIGFAAWRRRQAPKS